LILEKSLKEVQEINIGVETFRTRNNVLKNEVKQIVSVKYYNLLPEGQHSKNNFSRLFL
jgi:hypothetical protein